ncbi:MAG: BspA family leucine-rich repeat surface protein [Oscillospiraceae bacterium]|nr:BspA family leucine-rich repeat surface protein [Oscillospiraceae bacterium]
MKKDRTAISAAILALMLCCTAVSAETTETAVGQDPAAEIATVSDTVETMLETDSTTAYSSGIVAGWDAETGWLTLQGQLPDDDCDIGSILEEQYQIDRTAVKNVYVSSSVKAGNTLAYMFWNFSSLERVGFENGCDMSAAQSMASMFSGCSSLEEVSFNYINTSNVTDMSAMFSGCSSLKYPHIEDISTANVTNMADMFGGCSSLTSVDLSKMSTSKVTDMRSMFRGCSSLDYLSTQYLDTQAVTNMNSMFYECSFLGTLDLSGFDTSKVTEMDDMFYGCTGLREIDVSGFDTTSLESVYNMFGNCTGISYLDLSSFPTTIRDMYGLFANDGIIKVKLPAGFKVSSGMGLSNSFGDGDYDGWAKEGTLVPISGDGANASFTADETAVYVRVKAPEAVEAVPATCTEAGNIAYYKTEDDKLYTKENGVYTETTAEAVVIPASGHSYAKPKYTWASDYSSCSAYTKCSACSDEQREEGTVSHKVKTKPTCTAVGTTTYTAKFTNTVFSKQTKNVKDIPALGHNYGAPVWTWSADRTSASAAFTCGTCSDVQTVEAVVTRSGDTATAKVVFGGTTYTDKSAIPDKYLVAKPTVSIKTAFGGRTVQFLSTDKDAEIYYSFGSSAITTSCKHIKAGGAIFLDRPMTGNNAAMYFKAYKGGKWSVLAKWGVLNVRIDKPLIVQSGAKSANNFKVYTQTKDSYIVYTLNGTVPAIEEGIQQLKVKNGRIIWGTSGIVNVPKGRIIKAIAIRNGLVTSEVMTYTNK